MTHSFPTRRYSDLRIGAGLAETGDRTDDQAREVGTQSRRVESIFGQPADLVILDHHIGIGEQGAQFRLPLGARDVDCHPPLAAVAAVIIRSEEHTSELQSLMRTSYAAFCLK